MIKTVDAFKNGKAFIAFLTAGDPDIETTAKLLPEIDRAGADLIEIGIPFSDPVAEGVVIQDADMRALASGTTTDKVFDMVAEVAPKLSCSLAFMTYINVVYVYGVERFISRCAEIGVSAVIVPDVPFEEREELTPICEKYGVDFISFIAPTSKERIQTIAKEAKGFLYCVSSLGVTGVRSEIKTDVGEMIKLAKEVTDTPCAVGFGIATPEQAQNMAKVSDGIIVGSAIVKIIAEHGRESAKYVYDYVKSMKDAIREI
ncbi:MAG: tryptophan synthase subunit alpha [Ruminococcus sp.]|nr:tryptophan synthase subunit alpha [Ruminococcus sp.]